MPDTYAYTADQKARLVLSGWAVTAAVYNNYGGKVYAERWVRRGGFISLFQTYGWVAADAENLSVTVDFQGVVPGLAPLLQTMGDVGSNRHQVEKSIWAVGLVTLKFPGGQPGLPTVDAGVRGVRVRGNGRIDGQQLTCAEVVAGRFLT